MTTCTSRNLSEYLPHPRITTHFTSKNLFNPSCVRGLPSQLDTFCLFCASCWPSHGCFLLLRWSRSAWVFSWGLPSSRSCWAETSCRRESWRPGWPRESVFWREDGNGCLRRLFCFRTTGRTSSWKCLIFQAYSSISAVSWSTPLPLRSWNSLLTFWARLLSSQEPSEGWVLDCKRMVLNGNSMLSMK